MSRKYSPEKILEKVVNEDKYDREADINSDGKVSAADARKLSRIDAGLESPVMPIYPSGTDMSKELLDKILSSPDYSYDVNADPLYKHYKQLYETEGKNAAENIFGLASALSGGYGNSYASSAAAKAFDAYTDKLANKAAELEKTAYERHKNGLEELYKQLSAASSYEDRDYSRYRDSVSDYYKDIANINDEKEKELTAALKKADIGDYSDLEKLGVDTSALKKRDEKELAEFYAKYSDYSLLKKLGVDTSKVSESDLLDIAKVFASYGDYSLLEKLGADTSKRKEKDTLERELLKARKYRYYK